MNITITGWIGYDDKFYHRTISSSNFKNPVNAAQFIQHIKEGNTRAAYDDVFQAYGIGRGVVTVADDNPDIDISFSD